MELSIEEGKIRSNMSLKVIEYIRNAVRPNDY